MTVSLPEKTSPAAVPQAGQPATIDPPRQDAEESAEDVFVFPATSIQRRFWLLDQLVTGGNPALNMPLAVRLTGRLDIPSLEHAFQEVMRRHEVLRTSFHCEKGQLQQVISPVSTLPLPLVDARDFPASERARVPEHLQAEEIQRPFDLANGPVIRARLVRIAASEHLLLITVHHIVSDGWGNGVLLRELGELYGAYVQGRPSPLPELPIQFADFALWQNEHAAEPGTDHRLDYWRRALAGVLPALDLPANRLRRPVRGHVPNGGIVSAAIPVAMVQAIKSTAVREGVSAFMIHLAVYALLLNRYSGGQEDILINTPSANRDQSEIEPLIGPFANPLLLRLDLTGDPTLRELAGRVRQVVLGAFEHASAPFEKLLEELQPRRLQADFTYQNNLTAPARLPELDFHPLSTTSSFTLGEWSASVIENGPSTVLSIVYNADLYDAPVMSRVLAVYVRLLEAVTVPEDWGSAVSRMAVESQVDNTEGRVLLADRWRLPRASARWIDCCFEHNAALADGALGSARAGTAVLVLDRHLQAPPIGVEGEVYVGRPPESVSEVLNEFQWVEHPLHGRLLKTGDLARVQSDGSIEWLGRADEEIKMHGLRVNSTGIAVALQAHPHVVKAAVMWRGEAAGVAPGWTAFFQSDGAPPALVSHSQLRDFLRETLPEELIPVGFVPLDRFPLTTDGRLDTAALPDPILRTAAAKEERYDAPYLTIHHQMIEIWRDILGVPSVGIRDDFFALGGNSLLAMQMLYRVEQACGKALLPATLFQQATVEHLADELLRQDHAEAAPDVIKICETGSKTPIFYLHGDLTGGGYYCMKLSRRLGPDQPFYALPPLGGDAVRGMPSIEEVAAAHLEMVRAVRPHGPYVLGGFCLGGLIAQEMARQLETQGEKVERLLIIDATAHSRLLQTFRRLAERLGRQRGWSRDRQLYHFCRWHFWAARFNRWKGLDGRQQGMIIRHRLADVLERVRHWVRRPKQEEAAPSSRAASDTPWFDPRWDVPLYFLWAIGGHRVKPCSSPTILLLSYDLVGGGRGGPQKDWKKYNSRLETRELVGSHLACITEHADSLAETIRSCLEEHAD